MTILNEEMMSGLGDRYITPEYLSPLPNMSDSSKTEKSPLQLLAQTCSQIGADTGSLATSSKLSLQNDKSKPKDDKVKKAGSPAIVVSDSSPVSFKPYESVRIEDTGARAKIEDKRMSSSSSPKSSSPVVVLPKVDKPENSKSSSLSSAGTSPVIRSGMEVLAGHSKDSPLGPFKLQSSLETNPAFRPPGLPGYPGASMPHHGVCRDPYCRDPTCPTAIYNAQLSLLSSSSSLPPGYLELLEAYKMSSMGVHSLPASTPMPSTASLGPGGPYICNWMNGREYCGKRYTNAEELLVHLKTHTSLSTSESSPSLSPLSSYTSALFGGPSAAAAAAASLRSPYPSALSLAASRYSPYSKPGLSLHPSLASPGLSHPSLPPSLSYPASLYSLYGARL